MGKRLILLSAGAVMVLALAAPAALAAGEFTTPVPYGWLLQLRAANHKAGLYGQAFHAMSLKKGFAASVVDSKDGKTYAGMPLYRLVGVIDDNDPATFNKALATTGDGYLVKVEGLDGFVATYTSAEVVTFGKHLVVGDYVDGLRLTLGAASIKDDGAGGTYAAWKPYWPLKLASDSADIVGNRKPAAGARISIEPVVTGVQASPFDGGVGANAATGWTLTCGPCPAAAATTCCPQRCAG